MTPISRLLAAALLCVSFALPVNAAIYDVTISGSTTVWKGEVDTTTDQLVITQWLLNDGSHWRPDLASGYQLVLEASQGRGLDPYDVPDNWDGSIGTTWAFVSQDMVRDMPWLEGTSTHFGAYMAWGGRITGVFERNYRYDEYGFAYVPIGDDDVSNVMISNVEVKLRDDGNGNGGGEVPEPGTMLLLGSAAWFAIRGRGRRAKA